MGVRILESSEGKAAFYCSTTNWAFGPIFDSAEIAEAFLQWLPGDPRRYKDRELSDKFADFAKHHVCECGDVADGKPGEEDADGQPVKPVYGFPCTDGKQFVCNYCQEQQANEPLWSDSDTAREMWRGKGAQ